MFFPAVNQCSEGDSNPITQKFNTDIIDLDCMRCNSMNFHKVAKVSRRFAITDTLEAVFGMHQFAFQTDDVKVMEK
jgi:hypothetical protein